MLEDTLGLEAGAKYKIIIYKDITQEAKKIFRAVRQCELNFKSDLMPEYIGLSRSLIISMLHGARDKLVMKNRLNKFSSYGSMSDTSRRKIREYIDCLIEQGYLYLQKSDVTYTRLRCLMAKVNSAFHGEKILIKCNSVDYIAGKIQQDLNYSRRKRKPKENSGESKQLLLLPELKPELKPEQELNQELTLNLSDDDAELYNILRGVRMRLAGQEKVSAFIICHNEVLNQMVMRKPRNITELLSISGIGKVKAERYGPAFLEQIIKWLDRD